MFGVGRRHLHELAGLDQSPTACAEGLAVVIAVTASRTRTSTRQTRHDHVPQEQQGSLSTQTLQS